MGFFDFFSKKEKETLDKGLEKTKTGVFSKLAHIVAGRSKVDDDLLDEEIDDESNGKFFFKILLLILFISIASH